MTQTPGRGKQVSDFANIALTPTFKVSVSVVPISDEESPAAEPLGITEKNEITFGYAFLSKYKTIWDFDEKKIYLLKP